MSTTDAERVIRDRLKSPPQPSPLHAARVRAFTGSRAQNWIAVGGLMLGAGVVLGPWMWGEYKELLGYAFVPVPASTMPRTSPAWWENEWRKMNVLWRSGESTDDFFMKPYRFVQLHTGRDLFSASAFAQSSPQSDKDGLRPPCHSPIGRLGRLFSPHTSSSRSVSLRFPSLPLLLPNAESRHRSGENNDDDDDPRHGMNAVLSTPSVPMPTNDPLTDAAPVRALVPLCGDSPMVGVLARQGYTVDAVDCAETAIRAAVERTERMLPVDLYERVHLHQSDIFSPELWQGALAGRRYDVIYERQGMPSLNREQREDYAFLLKQALKEEGVMYVEGVYRTGRVKGNKLRGPPYSLTRNDLARLFPQADGYTVRCEEKPDTLRALSRENRILQHVPREYYAMPFSCVVFRDAAVNRTRRDRALHKEARAQNKQE